jgi:hypothetical protein
MVSVLETAVNVIWVSLDRIVHRLFRLMHAQQTVQGMEDVN